MPDTCAPSKAHRRMCLLRTWTPTPGVGIILQLHTLKQTQFLTSRARTCKKKVINRSCRWADVTPKEIVKLVFTGTHTHIYLKRNANLASVRVQKEIFKGQLWLAELRLNIMTSSVSLTLNRTKKVVGLIVLIQNIFQKKWPHWGMYYYYSLFKPSINLQH